MQLNDLQEEHPLVEQNKCLDYNIQNKKLNPRIMDRAF